MATQPFRWRGGIGVHQSTEDRDDVLGAIEGLKSIMAPQELGCLALTYLGARAAGMVDIGYSEADPFSSEETFLQEQSRVEAVLNQSGLMWQKAYEVQDLGAGFTGAYVHYYVGKDSGVVEELVSAVINGTDAQAGKLLGYPETATEAYELGSQAEQVDEYLIEAYELYELLCEQEFQQLYQLGIFHFLPFRLSRANWKEELHVAEGWLRLIKQHVPHIYQGIRDHKAYPLIKSGQEYWEQWIRRSAELHLQNVRWQVENLNSGVEKPIAENLRELVILLNGLSIRTTRAWKNPLSVLIQPKLPGEKGWHKEERLRQKVGKQVGHMYACVESLFAKFADAGGVYGGRVEWSRGGFEFTLYGVREEIDAFTSFLRANFAEYLFFGYLDS